MRKLKKLFRILIISVVLIAFNTVYISAFDYSSPISVYPDRGGYYGFSSFHPGIDYKADVNTPVYSVLDGTVVTSYEAGGYGDSGGGKGGAIVIQHKDKDNNTFYALYGHLNRSVEVNAKVYKGQQIGTIRPYYDGANFLPHLHFGINTQKATVSVYTGESGWVNPENYLNEHCKGFSGQIITPISVGTEVQGNITTPGAENIYNFTPDHNGKYIAQSTGYYDTYGTLLNNSWEVIKEDDDSGGNRQFMISCDLSAGATYYIKVRGYSNSTTGVYGLKITEAASDQITFIPLFSGVGYADGTFNTGSPVSNRRNTSYKSLFTFDGTAGQQIKITMTSTDFDSYLYLIGPNGNEIARDDDSAGNYNSLINRQLEQSGRYTIEATQYAQKTGSYQINLELSGTSTGLPSGFVPDTPSGLYASSIGQNYVNLNWNGISGAQNYQVYCCDQRYGNYWGVGASDVNSIIINGLSPGITYWFKVKAHNESGDSCFSQEISVTTTYSQPPSNQPNPPANVPSVPSGLWVTSIGGNYVSLSWDYVSGAENYQVYCCDRQDGGYWGVGASDNNSITVNGLSPGIRYWFKVRAHNGAGDSGFTYPIDAVTR